MKRLLYSIIALFCIGALPLYPMLRRHAHVMQQADKSYVINYSSGQQVVISPMQMQQILSNMTSDQRGLFLCGNTGTLSEYVDQNMHLFSNQNSVAESQSSSANSVRRAADIIASQRQASAHFREQLTLRGRCIHQKESLSIETISLAEILEATEQKVNEYIQKGKIGRLERYADQVKRQLSGNSWAQKQHEIIEKALARDDVQMLAAMQRGSLADAQELLHQVMASTSDKDALQGARTIVANKKQPKNEIVPLGGQPNRLVDQPAPAAVHADMVSTPVHSVPNISVDVDLRIEVALKHLDQINIAYAETHGKSVSFGQQMKAVDATLNYMKEQGLLTKSKDEFQEALWHGTVHFLKEFDPSSIVDNPREFIVNVTQHIAIATFHIMTDGIFLPADQAVVLGTQVYDLYQMISADHSDLNPNQRVELIAEQVAAVVRTIFAHTITRRVLGDRARGGGAMSASNNSSTSEVHEVVASDGTRVQVRGDESSASTLKSASEKPLGGSSVKKAENMKKVFEKYEFGKVIKKNTVKTRYVDVKTDSQIYEVVQKLPKYGLKKGDLLYLDKYHGDHIEVYRNKRCIDVLNLDGTQYKNVAKALGRDLKTK